MNECIPLIQDVFSGLDDPAAMWLNRFKNEEKHIYLFGAGLAGQCFLYTLRKYGVTVYAFCDNDIRRVGSNIGDIPVASFQTMCKDSQKYVIISAINAFWDLTAQCEKAGINSSEICYIDWLWYDRSERELVLSKTSEMLSIYKYCSDSASKTTFITALINRMMRDRRFYKDIKSNGTMYFENNLLHLTSGNEVFFDCGAADGDTAQEFFDLFSGKVYAFEPGMEVYQKLLANTANNPNIVSINSGVGDTETTRAFDSTAFGLGGSFEEGGDQLARLCTIDHALPEVPTFIKMDIQGYEMNALRGAAETIKLHKPKMAICVYHKISDFFDVPMYVLSLRPDYKVYFRHYRDDVGDTVCYFV